MTPTTTMVQRIASNDPTLTECNLISLGFSNISELAEALKSNRSLKKLDLRRNRFGPAGGVALAGALKVNIALTDLNLCGGSDLTDIKELAEALKSNRSLSKLNLSYNKFGAAGGVALAGALKVNVALTNLVLFNCNLTDIKELAEALKSNRSLSKLDLSGNAFGPAGVAALAGALKVNVALTDLNLGRCYLTDIKELADALKSNHFLSTLALERNKFGSAGGAALADALKTNATLEQVGIYGCEVETTTERQINEKLAHNKSLKAQKKQNNDKEKDSKTAAAVVSSAGTATMSVQNPQTATYPVMPPIIATAITAASFNPTVAVVSSSDKKILESQKPLTVQPKQSNQPIPSDLPQLLHSAKTPWHISPSLFEKVRQQLNAESTKDKSYAVVSITNTDPEYAFVLRYFQHQKPPGYSIKSIRCIHNPDQTKGFESSFKGMEAAAKAFPTGWQNEEPKAHRAKTIERWRTCVAPFSPFQVPSNNRVDKFVDVKVIPLWHGSKHVDSICKIGFTFFGKHHFFDKSATAGAQASTDIGYFGSGIYFTNSARYAAMYHSGSLLVSWVSMREPYPVVNDVTIPKKGKDMLKLQGKAAYQNYNAHYIPVTSTDPKEPENMIYHPCHETEQPAWDEYVVFQNTQALPRFIVELGVDLPVAVSTPVVTVEALNNHIITLLDSAAIQADTEISAILTAKCTALFQLNPQSPLSSEDSVFYNRVVKLIDPNGKLRPFIKTQLATK